MLKRRLLFSFFAFIFSCAALAYTGDTPFNSLYLAADIGAIQFLAKNKQNVDVTGQNRNVTIVNTDNHPENAKTDITGGVAIGLSYLTEQCFYIALEGRADYQSPKISTKRNTTTTVVSTDGVTNTLITSTNKDVKLKETYGVLLKPGFAVGEDKETIVYGIVGAMSGKVSASSTANISITGAQNTSLSFSANQKNQRTTGVSGGIGIEHAFYTSSATIGAEYLYTSYGSVKFSNANGTTTGPNGAIVNVSNKVSVSTNQVMVKVAYRFAM